VTGTGRRTPSLGIDRGHHEVPMRFVSWGLMITASVSRVSAGAHPAAGSPLALTDRL